MKYTQLIALTMTGCLFAMSCGKSKKTAGLDLANLDTTTSPREDFYQYANGSWLKNNPIPASEIRWGSFNILADENKKAVHELLEEAAKANAAKGSTMQKVGDFYAAGMDSAAIEQLGVAAIEQQLKEIDAISDTKSLLKTVADFQKIGVGSMFQFFVYQDPKNSAVIVPQVNQGGLGLPDRDYYFNTDVRTTEIRKEYVAHLTKVFAMLGNDEATAATNAAKVMKLENEMAKASRKTEDLRDPNANYHKMTVEELNKLTTNLDWNAFLTDLGIKKVDYLVIGQPEYFTALNGMLKSYSIEDWKVYVRSQLLATFAGKLNDAFVKENFHFYGEVLSGQKAIKPRWKRVAADADVAVGEAIGQEYVKKYFTPEAKQRCLDMVTNLRAVYSERINKLDWMSPETKEKAQKKLAGIINKIGYPDKWRDYSNLEIDRSNYVQNVIRGNAFLFQLMVDKLGKPVDKSEWLMTPQTVNAYYNPQTNEIAFPAGILRAPFFDPQADDAINYGGIGAVIGHELTHGFDDQGRMYDAEGNLTDWWTKEDGEKFTAKAQMVIDQFNGYKVLDSMHVNGKLTLGENIADLGGLSIAYEAFKRTEQGKGEEKIDGFTPDQRFFLNWANVWRGNSTDQALALQVNTNPHSPGNFRGNGPISNMTEFYAAFGVQEGDKMWRPENLRAKIW